MSSGCAFVCGVFLFPPKHFTAEEPLRLLRLLLVPMLGY